MTDERHEQKPLTFIPEEELLHHLMMETPDHIYFKDLESRFIKISPGMADFLGIASPAMAVGKTDFDFFSKEHAHQAFMDEQRIIKTGNPIINMVEKETWRSDKVTWCSTTKMPLRNDEGEIIGTWGISRDITSRKNMELENKKLIKELQEALARIKDLES